MTSPHPPSGVTIPLGTPVKNHTARLSYNEYIVYNTSQVRMRYLVEI
jgi:poly [ADP-ribose] polymerase